MHTHLCYFNLHQNQQQKKCVNLKVPLDCPQDPAARPTAGGLMQHPFLQNIAVPPTLQQLIVAQSAKRAALSQLHHDVPAYHQQTMPRWSFGTQPAASEQQADAGAKHSPAAQAAPVPRRSGTLRSHQINMTFRDDGTVQHNPAPRHPSLAIMAQLAEAGLVSAVSVWTRCCSVNNACEYVQGTRFQQVLHIVLESSEKLVPSLYVCVLG